MTKAEMRTWMRARLALLGGEAIRARSAAVVGQLVCVPEFTRADVVMIYLAMPGEVDLAALAEIALGSGKRVAAPRVDWPARRLTPCLLRSLTAGVEIGPRNVPQPTADAPPCPLEDIDLILTPGLAFDPSGYRLGRGAGFYDRFLAEYESQTRPAGHTSSEQTQTAKHAHSAGHTHSARQPDSGTRAVCGVAFDEQIVDAVPRDAWDRPLDLIATDQRVIRPPG